MPPVWKQGPHVGNVQVEEGAKEFKQFLKAQGAKPSQSRVRARSWPMMVPWQPPSPGTTSPLMPLSRCP